MGFLASYLYADFCSFNSHVGLITTKSIATLCQEITHSVEHMRFQLNSMSASGDTALWDSVALAADQLKHYAQRYPSIPKRIVVLSDGEDTRSQQRVHDLSLRLLHDGILLDSISLGMDINDELICLSYLTGGYKFAPSTLEEAMAICELEPVLSQSERPKITLPAQARRHLSSPLTRFSNAMFMPEIDIVTRDIFPERKELPGLSESFIELSQFTRRFNIAARTDLNLRLSRIHNEIRNCGAKIHP